MRGAVRVCQAASYHSASLPVWGTVAIAFYVNPLRIFAERQTGSGAKPLGPPADIPQEIVRREPVQRAARVDEPLA